MKLLIATLSWALIWQALSDNSRIETVIILSLLLGIAVISTWVMAKNKKMRYYVDIETKEVRK